MQIFRSIAKYPTAIIPVVFMVVALTIPLSAKAALLDFTLAWSGANFGNTANAVGSITLDDTVFLNPGSSGFAPPGVVGITDFEITVSGAASGNGTFGFADFDNFVFDTGGATLDLTTELVGQPTLISSWGSAGGFGGDFNFFSNTPAPVGSFFFTIATSGGVGDTLILTSFAPTSVVPLPAAIPLYGTALAAMGFLGWRRKRKAALRG